MLKLAVSIMAMWDIPRSHTQIIPMNFIPKSSVALLVLSVFSVFNPIYAAELAVGAQVEAPPVNGTLYQLILHRFRAEIQKSLTTAPNGMPGPLFLKHDLISDPHYVALIDNFESNPREFYLESKLLRLVTKDAVQNFDSNEFCREIVQHCLSVCPASFFVWELFLNAVAKRVNPVISMILENEAARNNLKDYSGISTVSDIAVLLAKNGDFALATELVRREVINEEAFILFACFMESANSESDFDNIQSFLKFLIDEMQNTFVCERKFGFESKLQAKRTEFESNRDLESQIINDEEKAAEKIYVH